MNYFNGPKLIRTHKDGDIPGKIYRAGILETVGDYIIKTYSLAFDVFYYLSPVTAYYIYNYGHIRQKDLMPYLPHVAAFHVVLISAILIRALGRKLDPSYVKFSNVYNDFYSLSTIASRRELDKYDFDFSCYPIDFDCIGHTVALESTPNEHTPNCCMFLPVQAISYLAIHTIGRRLVFPGSTGLVRSLIGPALIYGRGKLVEEYNGKRVRIRTGDNNTIDCMYIDRRATKHTYGDTLIICCEGNSGFYEIGTMHTPLDAGYSTIGWNHPGFGSSTGVPWPESEVTAVDSVMQYATQKLGFTPENIGVFAWSIGGFSATWLAKNYPEIKQVTIDASFDSLEPLAMTKMPKCISSLVGFAIHKYLNLNNAEQLIKYSGPLLLIRRRKDEMISTKGNNVAYNRTNILLTEVLKQRYPHLFTEDTMIAFNIWVAYSRSNQLEYEKQFNISESTITPFFTSYSFPNTIGKDMSQENKARCLIYVGSKYMVEYDSTHCTQLPGDMFTLPWNPDRHSPIGLQIKSTMKSLSSTTKNKIDELMGVKRRPTKALDNSKEINSSDVSDLRSLQL